MSERIPLAQPDLTGQEEAYVVDAIRSTWISSTGKYLQLFEQDLAEVCDTKHAAAVCNGTVALHLALLALDVRPGDEVLVPSLTYIATANAVRYVGAEPVFIDVDATWGIDPEQLESSITNRTRGIIAVHLYGHPADMDAINHIAAVHGLWVVEDAAEAPFARYKGRPSGSLARIGTFSFYGNKIMTSGEGGALTYDDSALDVRIRMLRGQGMDPDRRYYFPITGYNFRLTNVAAALLCAQMERAPAMIERRRAIYRAYDAALAGILGIDRQPVADWAEVSPWLYCVVVNERYGRSRDELMAQLGREGVETRPFFIPLHRLPPFRMEALARGTELPSTDRLAATGLNLPTFTQMTDAQIERICQLIADFAR